MHVGILKTSLDWFVLGLLLYQNPVESNGWLIIGIRGDLFVIVRDFAGRIRYICTAVMPLMATPGLHPFDQSSYGRWGTSECDRQEWWCDSCSVAYDWLFGKYPLPLGISAQDYTGKKQSKKFYGLTRAWRREALSLRLWRQDAWRIESWPIIQCLLEPIFWDEGSF